jgi:hypothetical protein
MNDADSVELLQKLQRVAAILAIQQLQNSYGQWLALFRADKIIPLFSRAPDVSLETAAPGVFAGPEAIASFFHFYCRAHEGAKGMLVEHYAICPVIEIDASGLKAAGTWFSPGILASASQEMQCWNWGKYACDFRKEPEGWKIWHLHWYPTFRARYELGWVREQQAPFAPPGADTDLPKTTRPNTYRKPYSPESVNYLLPEPPEPGGAGG